MTDLHPIYETEAQRNVRAEAYAREGEVWALIAHADSIATEIGFVGDTLDMLRDALAAFAARHSVARVERARMAYRAARAAGATRTRPSTLTGGTRPPEQSRRASAPEGADGGRPRGDHGSYDEGRRGDR